jgi:hypothetical protein
MSLSVYAKANGTQGALQVNGVDALILDTGGTVSGVRGTSISGLTITQANQTPLPAAGTLLSFTHGLGIIPVSAELELVCLTAEAGYSVGDVVTPYTVPNATYVAPFTIRKTSTVVEARTGSTGAFDLNNHTTGSASAVTAANWAWRFKVRVA